MSAAVMLGSGAAAGLVPVSTTVPQGLGNLPTVLQWAESVIEIDRQQARVTRLRKGVGMAGKWINIHSGAKEQKILVTLTYRGDNSNWRPEQISNYIRSVRKWYDRLTGEKLRYCWVAELQQRGVIHYHAVFWLRKGVTMPKADKRGWWPHGMSNTKKAIKPVGYLMKYVSKVDSKNAGSFPRGARLYGVGGLDKGGRDCKRWVLWPSYVRQNAAAGDPWRPAEGGGFVNSQTGQRLLSEWAPTGGGHCHFVRVRTTPRTMPDAGGPFSWISTNSAATGSADYLH